MPDPTSDPPLWQRREPDSPCINICQIHPEQGICLGCYRTRDEIRNWRRMEPEIRHALLAELPTRSKGLLRRRGGRHGRMARDEM